MNGFNKYVLRQLLVGMILVTTGLTCVIWLTQSLKFVEMIVNRGLTVGTFVYLTMLLLPNFLSVVLPIALFTVTIFVYSKMISDRELVVMRAAGVDQQSLARPAIILAFIIVAIGYLINLYLLPQSYRMFRDLQWDIRYSYSHILLQEGAFNEISDGITVYVRERGSDGQLHGIMVHDSRKDKKPYTLLAERGAMVEGDKNSRVVMFNGNRQEVDPETGQLSILYFDRYIFEIVAAKALDDGRFREARERSVFELFNLQDDPDLNPKDIGKFTVEGHKRLLTPLASLGYTLVGLAFLISGSFTRRTQTRRILMAAITVIGLQAALLTLENATARNLTLLPLMYMLVAIPIIGGYMAMIKPPRNRAIHRLQPAS
ncbi:MAG: LPS export ABC transporter permease LptF [Alphaproteobacteria bacterium]